MTTCHPALRTTGLLIALGMACLWLTGGGHAADDTLGDLGYRVRQQNLDSYWLENRTWAEYGYRPHITSHLTRFTNLPTVYSNRNYYAWGDNPPDGTIAEAVGRSPKANIQMTKYGTWH